MILKKILVYGLIILLLVSVPAYFQSAQATPWTGSEPAPTDLVFYLHNSSTGITVGAVTYLNVLSTVKDTNYAWNNTGSRSLGTHYDSASFIVAPQLAGTLQLNGTMVADIYMNQTGSSLTGGSNTLYVYKVNASGSKTLLGSHTNPNSIIPSGSMPGGSPVQLTGPYLNQTVPQGDSIMVTLNISGNTAESYGIWWGLVNRTYYESSVSFPVSSYLTVSTIEVLNYNGQNVTVLPKNLNSSLTIKATVQDPLGAYDFEAYPVDFSVINSTGKIIFSTPMLAYPTHTPPDALSGTYEVFYNYSALLPGKYHFEVNATDNTDHNLWGLNTLPYYYGRDASGFVTVTVGLPPVPIILKILDKNNNSLSGAIVQAFVSGSFMGTNNTNSSGETEFLLSQGTSYSFKVLWQNVSVGTFNETVYNNSTMFVFQANVIYPTFMIVSDSGVPLSYALVTLVHPNGTLYPLIVANSSGSFSLSQVPAGVYKLTVIYDDTEVLASYAVSVMSNGITKVSASNVYLVTIKSTTATGTALSGVFVQVQNATTGATIASGITNGSGTLQFLVPAGSYTVIGNWATTYDLTAVQQASSAKIMVTTQETTILTFSKAYPSIFATVLFWFILIIVLLLALLILLTVMFFKKSRKHEEKIEK
ncbi:MAG: carboxypeptidase-like regulatory domain-containing protein [Thermoplasmata archaeon]